MALNGVCVLMCR